ncbi:MAG: Cytochrome c oxidase subunit 1 [Candidatus Tokpelaia hoelldobleri]|uniref:Cytochrome c oxidase subunit 1 n=1 Tax=Candidatus Tokpelaia hoelldobleri TaxID=1902579 RepID=A0A1U9JW71_9HYPH|nr:MAG: Cytochrome c oxidase subunit 1 [Candidatus Tokpelaia hoelldoblerii]
MQLCRHGYKSRNTGHDVLSFLFLSTDHKTIGWLYFALAIIGGVAGFALSVWLRVALEGQGVLYTSMNGAMQFRSAHAQFMIFFMLLPALFGGFGNWLLPLMLGVGNVAFARLNRLAFWLFALGFALFIVVQLSAGSGAVNHTVTAVLLCLVLYAGVISLVLQAVNFIVTILVMRPPVIRFQDCPPFVWAVLITSGLLLFYLPVMLGWGSLALWRGGAAQQWFIHWQDMLNHPELYVLLLPVFGIISHIVTTFSRSPLYGQKYVIAVMAFIGLAGFALWAQTIFAGRDLEQIKTWLAISPLLIGLPMLFLTLSWLVTMSGKPVTWQVPMLWAGGCLFSLVAGIGLMADLVWKVSLTGLPLSFMLHVHYVLSLSAVFALCAGWYFWFPKMAGLQIRVTTGMLHFWLMFIAAQLLFLPLGMAKTGSMLAACSVGVFIYGIVEAFVRGIPAGDNPWGEGATTLEWQLSSPPQVVNAQGRPA